MWEERGGDAPGMGRSTDLGHWGDTSDGRAGHCCIPHFNVLSALCTVLIACSEVQSSDGGAGHCCIPLTMYWVHCEASALPYIKVSCARTLQHITVHYRAILYWADPCTACGSAGKICWQCITMHGSVASCCCPSQDCIGELVKPLYTSMYSFLYMSSLVGICICILLLVCVYLYLCIIWPKVDWHKQGKGAICICSSICICISGRSVCVCV